MSVKLDSYGRFRNCVEKSAKKLLEIDKSKNIRLVSHLDADGISACSIMIHALDLDGRNYSVSIVRQLSEEVLRDLSQEEYEVYIFTDLGSSHLKRIKKYLKGRKIFILDHHNCERGDDSEDIVHVNPHLFGIDGSREISGAGVVLNFCRAMDKRNEDMAHIAIVGALGDVQEKDGFLKLNDEILQIALKRDKLMVSRGLRVFGMQTKYLHKLIEHSYDLNIPDVTGSESATVQFLKSLNIDPKRGGTWKKYNHLTTAEQKRLLEAIILRRAEAGMDSEAVYNHYLLIDEKQNTLFRDAREFATALNACGRMDKASVGIGACLGDEKMKRKVSATLSEYKREIGRAWQWFHEKKGSDEILKGDGYLILNMRDHIRGTLAGTFASILSKSREIPKNTFVMSLAQIDGRQTKVSLRISGRSPRKDIDLRDVIAEISLEVEGESGGHKYAAGAIIDLDRESDFVDKAKRTLERYSMDEKLEAGEKA